MEMEVDPSSSDTEVLSNWDVAGKVEKIQLINFMCHKNLTVTLHEGVNFISGMNGSGKSAIMTGLVLGLGGRASATNRGNSLKELITKGKNHFEIMVYLRNVGPYSFKHDIYGDVIKIHRIVREKSSGYEMCNAKGKVVTKSREELDKMLFHFKIAINNPVAILNQDTARNFLRTKNNNDLYTLFLLSSGLQELREKHDSLGVVIRKIWAVCKEQKKTMLYNFRDVVAFRKKFRKFKELTVLKEEKTELLIEEAWGNVFIVQNEVDGLREKIQPLEAQAKKNESMLKKKEGTVANLQNRMKEIEAELKDFGEESFNLKDKLNKIETSLANVSLKIQHFKTEAQSLNNLIIHEVECVKKLEEILENIDGQNSQACKKREQLTRNKEEIKAKITDLESVKSTNEVHLKNLREDFHKKASAVKLCEAAVRQTKYKRDAAFTTLRNLRTNEGTLNIFSNKMPIFVREIEKAYNRGEFQVKPIGPIGHHLKLLDESWGPAIECFIGEKFLHSFCVNSSKDASTMETIAKKCDLRQCPSLIISPFLDKVHTVRKISHPQYKTLLQTLTIESVPVFNALIDCKQVESVLLIPTGEQANKVMGFVENVPKFCTLALTKIGDIFFPAPRYRCNTRKVRNRSYYLQTDKNLLLRSAEEDFNLLQAEDLKLTANLQKAVKESHISKQNLNATELEIQKASKKLQDLNDLLFKLDMEEIPEDQNREIIQEDLCFRKSTLTSCKSKLESIKENLESTKSLKQEHAESKAQLTASIRENDTKVSSLKVEMKKLEVEYKHLTISFDSYKSELKMSQNKIQELKCLIKTKEEEILEKERFAKELGGPFKTLRGLPDIKKSILKVESKIRGLSEYIGDEDIESLAVTFSERSKVYYEQMNIYGVALKSIASMIKRYPVLRENMEQLKYLLASSLMKKFEDLLSCRNYKGKLDFDHETQTLSISVCTNNESTSKNTKTLSGGERSFSMTSFILALWDEMKSPFYFLDEFDVFMDNLNRDTMMSLITIYGQTHPDRQFVLMTPNSFRVSQNSSVVTFRMPDPRMFD